MRWSSYVDFEQVNASLEIAYKCLPNVQWIFKLHKFWFMELIGCGQSENIFHMIFDTWFLKHEFENKDFSS